MAWFGARKRQQVEVFALLCEAIRRSVQVQLADEHVGIALALCDQLDGKHPWRVPAQYKTDEWTWALPTNQDRSLIAGLLAFYYARLLPGVHVLLPDQEQATNDAVLYRKIARELDARWRVGLLSPQQPPGQRKAAFAAHVTVGSVDDFHASNTAGHLPGPSWSRLAIFRLASAPQGLQTAYGLATRLPDPATVRLFHREGEQEEIARHKAESLRCPPVARKRVKAIRLQRAASSSVGADSEPADQPQATGFTLVFRDLETGERVAGDPGLVEALLAKHDRTDLVGQRYYGRPSPAGGYEITFPK